MMNNETLIDFAQITEQDISAVLCQGSGFVEGKFRIFLYFKKEATAKENEEFLKREYGTGGVYPAVSGTQLDQWYDAKGYYD